MHYHGLVSPHINLPLVNFSCCILVEHFLYLRAHWWLLYAIPLSLPPWLPRCWRNDQLLYIPAPQTWSPGCATPKQAVEQWYKWSTLKKSKLVPSFSVPLEPQTRTTEYICACLTGLNCWASSFSADSPHIGNKWELHKIDSEEAVCDL